MARLAKRLPTRRPRLEVLEDRALPSVVLGLGIDGTNYQNAMSGSVPPDTIAAAGPTHVMELVNSAIAIYTKAGTLVSRQLFSQFFSKFGFPNSDLFDPQVRYDELAGRFIVGVDQQNSTAQTSNYLFAVSNTSDPTQGFTEMHKIALKQGSGSSASWGDFPHLGYNADTYTLTTNQFGFSSGFFTKIQLIRIAKTSVLDKNNSTFTMYRSSIAYSGANFTLIPAEQHGAVAGDPVWAVEVSQAAAHTIRIAKITNALSSMPIITWYAVSVPSFGSPPAATSAGNVKMDTGDTRILSVALRNGRLVTAHTVGLNSVATAVVNEFNVSGSSPSLTQTITIAPGSGINTYYPSVDINSAGDLGVTYMESSSSEMVSMYVGGQVTAGSPLQTALAQAGLADYTAFDGSPHRAGDYSGITVDPVDDSFWAANEYATAATSDNWGTHIRNFTVTSTVPPPGGGSAVVVVGPAPASGGGMVGRLPIREDVPVVFAWGALPSDAGRVHGGGDGAGSAFVRGSGDARDAFWALGLAEELALPF
jgi:hypothetical protein